ncbi:MAG: zinc metalloprotease [Saprospiraceae bacterium]|nr:zinc metalloprotease [Saprospiraceae bacterium]MDW8484784.1 zinc metalloprotease [Saprospiraceae bacterium]
MPPLAYFLYWPWARFFFVGVLIAATLAAQAQPMQGLPVLCGQEVFHWIVQKHYPQLHQAFEATFEACRANAALGFSQERSPYVIPVVFHVVWKNPEENLHDSILINQIDVLNEDYNRQNADTNNLRSIFRHVAGNARIRFELHEIRRVKTNANFQFNLLSGELLTNLKNSAQGGSNAKDPSRYLNIWICRIQPLMIFGIPAGQILGFAFPPNNLPNWPANSGAPSPGQDGVVLDFRTVGRNNPNPMPNPIGGGNLTIRGRTATHEIGHYLGLRHIWGDGDFLGTNNCNQSDGIDDTPFANSQSQFDCNKNRNTCLKIEPFYGSDMPDLVENFMDYSSESCVNMFTRGQVNLMHAVLQGPRKQLVQSSSNLDLGSQPMSHPMFYPNPTEGSSFWVSIPPEWLPCQLSIWSIDGRLAVERSFALLSDREEWLRESLESTNLRSGWYVARFQKDNRCWTTSLCVLK